MAQSKREKDAIALVNKEKESYERATRTWREEAQKIWKAYNGEIGGKIYPWQSKYFIPKLRTETSYILPFVFSGDPEVELEGVGEEDQEISKLIEKIENYRMRYQLNSFEKISDWVLQGIAFGTSVIKVKWVFETEKKKEEQEDENGEMVSVEYETPTKDEPQFEVPNILDIFVDPLKSEIEEQTSLIERSVKPVSEIKKNPAYKVPKNFKAKGNFGSNIYDSQQLNDTDLDETDTLQTDTNHVEILERWSKDRIITIANGQNQIVLRDVKNPYGCIPYEKFVYEEAVLPNRFYGLGVGQNGIDLQEMYYDLFNQIIDNVKNVANKMYIVRSSANFNPRDFISKPGGVIRIDDTKDVIPVEQSDVKQSIFDILGIVGQEHQLATGANNLVQGQESGDTLGQDELRQQNSTNRFGLVQKRFKHALSRTMQKLIKMDLYNLQDVDAPILRIFPEEMRETVFSVLSEASESLQYNVYIKGDTTMAVNKDVVRKQMVDLYNLAKEILSPTEQRAFIRSIVDMGGILNIVGADMDSLVAEEPPVPEGMEGGEQMPEGMEGAMPPGMPQGMPPLPQQELPSGGVNQAGINQSVYGQR